MSSWNRREKNSIWDENEFDVMLFADQTKNHKKNMFTVVAQSQEQLINSKSVEYIDEENGEKTQTKGK